MLIDPNSYLHDTKFGWLTQELEIIEDSFIDYLNSGIELVKSKNEILEQNRQNSIRDLDNSDNTWDKYIYEKGITSNYYLERSFIFSGVSYLYSQLEIKLFEIKELSKDYLSLDEKSKFNNHKFKHDNGLSSTEQLVNNLTEFYKLTYTGEIKVNWDILCDFREIRKRVVHYNGSLTKKPLDEKFQEEYKDMGISILNGEIIIDKTYLITIMGTIRSFLTNLMKLIWETEKS
jgi:hypothetical protein